MIVLRHFDEAQWSASRGGFVSIGNFDGVHCGHRSMLSLLTRHAHANGAPAVVFTFDPHPITILRPEQSPPPLTTTARKIELLEQCGVDVAIVYRTDRALLDLTPRQFFDQVIVGRLAARRLIEGPSFCFGHDRAGTVETLREFCESAGIGIEVVSPIVIGGRLVSSTQIRQLIISGRLAEAAELLGAPYLISGLVVRGAERGRQIGFPTANLENVATVLPRDGVYAGRAQVDRQWFAAGINVGPNPTFGEGQRKIEVHLADFSGDLYGRTLEVEFLERLRDTQPFGGIEALRAQLECDMRQARGLACREPAR